MKTFYLPDLGEGLPEAEISEWYVKVGDVVEVDQHLVSVETAKALVEVPSPFAGKIHRCYGNSGDVVKTGAPLVEFDIGEEATAPKEKKAATVAGTLKTSEDILEEDALGINTPASTQHQRPPATPAVRALAQQLGVDLRGITGSGPRGAITLTDVTNAVGGTVATPKPATATRSDRSGKVQGVKRRMAEAMEDSHAKVVPLTVTEEADIHHWAATEDTTVRLLQAVVAALAVEPGLNAYFNGDTLQHDYQTDINIGLAMDTPHGLFAPVIKDVAHQSTAELRQTIQRYKQEVMERTIMHQDLVGATILLSNFGSICGMFGNPTVIPPMVAIVGTGRQRKSVVAYNDEMVIHRILPISITVDHRVITGGELCRFLKAFINILEQNNEEKL